MTHVLNGALVGAYLVLMGALLVGSLDGARAAFAGLAAVAAARCAWWVR